MGPLKPNKLWTLRYNGDIILRGVPWPVLVAKEKELRASGAYAHLISKEFHKDVSRRNPKR
jgi:hypothetical protein